jgi:hypothetical protein
MKFQEALDIINKKEKSYMVSFEVRERGFLRSDYFPDKHADELLIPTEEEAWDLAERFAKATGSDVVNIYVIDNTFSPVKGYDKKKLKSY